MERQSCYHKWNLLSLCHCHSIWSYILHSQSCYSTQGVVKFIKFCEWHCLASWYWERFWKRSLISKYLCFAEKGWYYNVEVVQLYFFNRKVFWPMCDTGHKWKCLMVFSIFLGGFKDLNSMDFEGTMLKSLELSGT